MKHPTACLECRVTKRRCMQTPADPQSACHSCKSRNIECSKPWSKAKAHPIVTWRTPNSRPLAPSSTAQLWNDDVQLASSKDISEFVRLYFRFIHDRPHSLFHEQSLWHEIQNGTLSESLLAAICTLGCRFSPHEKHRTLVTAFTLRSKSLLAQQLEDISIPNVQTCILLANSYAAEQNNRLEALYFGIANRMAYVLGLHKQDHTDSPILRETKCRVWWSLYMADRWCPPGLGLPREIMCHNPTVETPMDEIDFQQLRDMYAPSITTRKNGLWTYKISLVNILASIQDMNLSLVQDEVDRSAIDRQVEYIAGRLLEWYDSLPPHMIMNEGNLGTYRKKGHGGTFVAMHLGYHHYSTLLYFQYLEPDYEPTNKSDAYAAKCTFHGLAFSRLLHTARELGDCHVVYLTVAHMTIVSSSVLLHLLLFGNEEEVETARILLTRNFEALINLSKYWPCVDKMKERLFIFQNACLRSSAAKTYAVDRWIMRFLLEYALPFEKKSAEKETPLAVSLSPNQDSTISIERRTMLDKALEDLRS